MKNCRPYLLSLNALALSAPTAWAIEGSEGAGALLARHAWRLDDTEGLRGEEPVKVILTNGARRTGDIASNG